MLLDAEYIVRYSRRNGGTESPPELASVYTESNIMYEINPPETQLGVLPTLDFFWMYL